MALNYIVNGSPVEVKKHQLMGPVGYTIVGSPTIVDGVVSGITTSDYVKTSQYINLSSVSSWEAVCRAKKSDNTEGVLWSTGRGRYGISFFVSHSKTSTRLIMLCVHIGNDEYVELKFGNGSSFTPDTYTYYKVQCINNETFTVGYSADGGNWNMFPSQTLSNVDIYNNEVRFGGETYWRSSSWGDGTGSIDLNETYIKVNGKLWFYQPAPTKYIVKDGKLVFADQGLYLTGPVNYTVVGSPTIVDGVVSGISSSNRLRPSTAVSCNENEDIEFNFAFTTSGTISTQWLFGYLISGEWHGIYITTSGISVPFARENGSTKSCSISYSLQTNTKYRINVKRESGQVTSALYNASGELLASNQASISAGLTTSNNTIGTNPSYSYGGAFGGSIDLKETYIKVNGSLWFYGKNYASANIAPVPAGYTYGTTTTTSIGYVDMRTQQFTAAPSGATIGRDE